MSEREIVRNQWRAWLRLFGLPLFLLVAALGTAATLSQLSIQRMAAQIPAATSPSVVTNQSSGFSNQTVIVNSTVTVSVGSATNSTPAWPNITTPGVWQQAGLAAGAAAAAILCTLANFLAIGWFGMWMGMTSRTANLATLKTLVFVQVIPWFVITFATGMVVGLILARLFWTGTGARSAGWLVWYPLISHALWAAATIIKDVGFILWSRNRLYSAFRNQAALSHERPRTAIPPPLPLPITGRAEATLTTDRRF